MSVARTMRCVFCTFKQATRRPGVSISRRIHASSAVRQSNKDDGLPDDDLPDDGLPDELNNIKPLTKQQIRENYTPAQATAIEATQANLKFDAQYQATTRKNVGPWKMYYLENLTEVDPVLDKPVRAPWTNLDDNSRLKTEDELDEDILGFMENMPENENAAADAFQNFLDTNRITVGKESAEFAPRSALAPDTTQVYKNDSTQKAKSEESSMAMSDEPEVEGMSGDVVSPGLLRVMQMTGMSQTELARLRVKSVVSHRVVNQTRLGKIQKQYWLSIAGNQNGLLGIGEGKSEEAAEALVQSQYRAIRNMVPVMRYEARTIFGTVKGKEGATELELYARAPGFGLRCSHLIWEMCRCAGITDLSARVTRARNPMNTVKAAFQAMMSQKDPEDIARGRGKKLVDVRKVYYAGNI
ncbi:28S ribosomal protein S5, mitochondrial [Lithohypha guttulata]|uniref:Small ribosomal subunit protein uS5m n=1 Tax=Lithohypha guttulata TaxID=1690604 RepID=A0AAN7SZQ0_9EURO|nr:28S ribosomal protein S5, mitochondrial [Lithohypha guttulata]